jgi:hypothetical protein
LVSLQKHASITMKTSLVSDPGKCTLVISVNGIGNLARVIGAQLHKSEYTPDYQLQFYVTLGFLAIALFRYTSYKLALQALEKRKSNMLASKSASQIKRSGLTTYVTPIGNGHSRMAPEASQMW